MKKRASRVLALTLAGAMALSLSACKPSDKGNGDNGNGSPSTAGDGKLFTEPTEISIIVSSHVSWPFNENWKMWDYVEEATGAMLKVSALPSSDQETKISLMMASPDTLPDLLHTWQKKTVDDYALSGAYLSYDDHLDLLPNYQKFWDSVPEEERKELFAQRTSGDGKIYSAPSYGTQTVNNLRTWMYRKDIFEKNNLQVPTTTDELYQVAKKLKELYPESYPICFRTGLGKLEEWGPSWQPYFTQNPYYDYDDETWKVGAAQPVMKDMVEFFLKLKNEDLVPPNYITMETKSWEELMSTDRGFITLDYIVRIDFFNKPNREQNPDYTLALMAPPKPNTAQADQKLMKSNLDFYGYCVCNTGKEKNIENAFKFVDWMYTDDAVQLLSWGKEGETFHTVDGRKQFILTGDEQPQNAYGIGTYGLYQVIETEANEAMYTVEQVEACHDVMQYLMPRSNPTMWMPISEDNDAEVQTLKQPLNDYIEEQLSKFMLGQTPMSEWDTFQKGLEDMGASRLLEIYAEEYKRVMG